MARHNDTGKWGEDIAREYLTAQGYAIAESNWRSGHYEIDLITYKGNRIVFVEVKTRGHEDDDPLTAVDRNKAKRLVRAARVYVESKDIDHEMQFDLIAINGTPESHTIEHIVDAIESPLHTY